jgi:hypothetical protein
MFSHLMLGTNDIERSQRFYDAVLGVLGAGAPMRNENKTGQTRLFYRHDGGTFCVSEPLNGEPATFANGGTVGFKCGRPSRCSSFTMWPWPTAAPRSKSRRACVKASWAPCSWPMCATRTATSSARCSGQPKLTALGRHDRSRSPSPRCSPGARRGPGAAPPPLRLRDFKLIAFDMDSTLINIECVDEIADAAGRKAEVAAITEAAMRGEITDYKDSLRRRVALLQGRDRGRTWSRSTERLRSTPAPAELVLPARRPG